MITARYAPTPMGQPVTVIEKPSSRKGVVRFDTNRVLSGTDHEVFTGAPEALADRPVDELARILFGTGRVAMIHINGNVITVQLEDGSEDTSGMRGLIEEMFTYYRQGVRVPSPADFEEPADEESSPEPDPDAAAAS